MKTCKYCGDVSCPNYGKADWLGCSEFTSKGFDYDYDANEEEGE